MATEIFVSYSHSDGAYLNKGSLLDHLQALQRDGARFWTDLEIPVGSDWHRTIMAQIRRADISVLLVSQAFLNSEYIRNLEIRSCLIQEREQGLFLFPIILSPCDWKQEPWLRQRQFIPTNDRTIEEHFARPPGVRKRMFQRIIEELRKCVAAVEETKRQPTSHAAAMQSLSTSVNVMNVIYPQLESVARNQPEEQRKYSVMLEGAGSHLVRKVRGAESNFTPADLEKLSDRQLRHILIFQRDLQRSYGKWKRWYARYCKERPAVSEETRIALRNVVADMKDSLDRVVAFLQEAHLDIEDHYAIFRSIVQAEAEASYGRRS